MYTDVRRKLCARDEFVVLVNCLSPGGAVLQFFGDVLQEGTPARSGPELRDVIRRHLDALVRGHYKTGARYMVNVVEISGRGQRREVF